MKKFYLFLTTLLFTALFLDVSAQTTIWTENFTYTDGTENGQGAPAITSWTADGKAPNGRGVDVQNNELEGRNTSGTFPDRINWEIDLADPIEIFAYTNVSMSVDLSESGNLENEDYIQVQYNLDENGWIDFVTNGYIQNDFGSAVASQTGLAGTSLRLRIIMFNSRNDEYHYADNFVVVGDPITSPPSCVSLISPTDGDFDVPTTTNLEWNMDQEATGYFIYFGTDNPPTNIENGTDLGNNTVYSPANDLLPFTIYYWSVVPYNYLGTPTGCDVWSFTTGDCTHCPSEGSMEFETSMTLVNFNTINNASAKPTASAGIVMVKGEALVGSPFTLVLFTEPRS